MQLLDINFTELLRHFFPTVVSKRNISCSGTYCRWFQQILLKFHFTLTLFCLFTVLVWPISQCKEFLRFLYLCINTSTPVYWIPSNWVLCHYVRDFFIYLNGNMSFYLAAKAYSLQQETQSTFLQINTVKKIPRSWTVKFVNKIILSTVKKKKNHSILIFVPVIV